MKPWNRRTDKVLIAACGQMQPTNNVKTISTDLPDSGKTGPVKMYWVSGESVYRGTCGDSTFVVKPNCQNDIESMGYAEFKSRLDAGVTATVARLVDELIAIARRNDRLLVANLMQ